MKKTTSILLGTILSFVLLCSSCSNNDDEGVPPIDEPPNILLIIADDLGKDAINGYSEGSIKPNTPNIDAIRNDGITFKNFWSYPTCTPTRASIITGKYGYRTGVKSVGDELATSEITLQKYISDKTNDKYTSAIVGKWHLSGSNTNINPESFGIHYYEGLLRGAVDNYYQWQLSEDGATNLQTEYSTTIFTDLAMDWINEQSKPWFLWLAYNAPHTPYHVPPSEMHSQGNLPDYAMGMDATPYYMAAIEAMDFQIGRLLNNLSEEEKDNTLIIFIGDNGTPNQVAQSPFSSSTVKNTLYQGGINVPMFISGAGVTRSGMDDNLITSTDLFATICEAAGMDLSAYQDSKSFKPLLTNNDNTHRDFQYAELNNDTDDAWAIRNNQYKLIVNANTNEEMYDLENDPYEQNNLLNGTLTTSQAAAKMELEEELLNIRQ